jgi:8-oxo-dGTP diphosphatase
MKHVEVVAAIICYKDEILCMKRPKGKHEYTSFRYEFPGGKKEADETHVDALKRELIEEMDMKVEVQKLFLVVNHQYPDFHLTMHCYLCRVDSKKFVMKEHVDFKWLKKEELGQLEWTDADKPILDKLINN